MKSLVIISFMFFAANAMAVCSSPIARTNLGNVVLTATNTNGFIRISCEGQAP